MTKQRFRSLAFSAIAASILVMAPALARADEKSGKTNRTEPAAEVELFQAMQDQQVDVKVIALGANRVNVIIENTTQASLLLKMPDVFAAVPVLGQIGGGLFGGGGQAGGGQFGGGQFGGAGGGQQGGGGQGGGGQGLGGGFGGGQGGGGQQGGGAFGQGQFGGGGGAQFGGAGQGQFGGGPMGPGGFMRVEPGRPRKMQVETVCLEHGKPDPHARMKYRLAPLNQLNVDPKVAELCRLLGTGKVNQNIVQAAAWNIANRVSWDELAQQNRRESNYTGNEKFFTEEELKTAVRVVGHCRAATEKSVALNSPTSSSAGR